MKTFNIMYVVAILAIGGIVKLFDVNQVKQMRFYGFTENDASTINYERNLFVKKIYVVPGQRVEKGALLLEATDSRLAVENNGLGYEKQIIDFDEQENINRIAYKLSELKIEKSTKLSEVNTAIHLLKDQIDLNKSLYSGLKSLKVEEGKYHDPKEKELAHLIHQKQAIIQRYNQAIALQKKLIEQTKKPNEVKKKMLDEQIASTENQLRHMSVYAPYSGVIGSILCKENEYIPAYQDLFELHKMRPTIIKGYSLEGRLNGIKIGAKVEIQSTRNPAYKIVGEVTGLGSQIVEIPERLRKFRDFKIYGQEIIIRVPEENELLQNEKVLILVQNNSPYRLFTNLVTSGQFFI